MLTFVFVLKVLFNVYVMLQMLDSTIFTCYCVKMFNLETWAQPLGASSF